MIKELIFHVDLYFARDINSFQVIFLINVAFRNLGSVLKWTNPVSRALVTCSHHPLKH